MENKLNALSELIEKLVRRIDSARDNNTVSRIEADIILDLLRQAYLAAEELKTTGAQTDYQGGSAVKQVIQEKHPEIVKLPEEAPAEDHKKEEILSVYAAPAISEVQDIKPAVAEAVPEQQPAVFSEPEVVEEPVAESTPESEEIIQPRIVSMDEVPVMSFPKVEVVLEKPAVVPEFRTSPQPVPVTEPVMSEPEPPREIYSPPAAPVNPVRQSPEVTHTDHSASTHHTPKPAKAAGDLFANQTIADKLRNDTQSVNEKITQGKTDQSLAQKLQLKPISDLRTAIGINEKFQFVNDLFEGRIDLYNDAVSELNSCGSGLIADRLFDEMRSRHNWNENADAFSKLKTFVTRRYL